MRPRSITGPIILIAIGLVFLLNNLGRDIAIWPLLADYWPVLLIVLGVVGLVEVLYYASRGTAVPPRPLSGGGWFWLFVLIAFVSWGGNRGGIHIGPFTSGGINILGSDFDYDVNSITPSQGVTRLVFDNVKGNLSVKGGQTGDIKITGHKNVRAFNRADADRGDQQSQLRVERQGDLVIVHADEPHSSRMLSVSADLDIVIPAGIDVEARGRNGDLTFDDIGGAVEILNGRGDVRLNRIAKDVKIDGTRGGLVRTVDIKGNVELQGRGGDVQIENIAGQTTVNGEFSGNLEFRALAKPFRFTSQRSDFRVEAVPGTIELDLSELKLNNVTGPVRFQSGSRDIHVTDVTNALEITLDRGDIEVSQTKTPLPKMDLRVRNGDINVGVPQGASFSIDGRTGQGDVTNDFGGGIVTDSQGRSGTLKGRSGTGPQLTLNTDRGSLTIKKN